jgi:hypothetical protein
MQYNYMKTYGEVDVYLHAFLNLALDIKAVNFAFWPLYSLRNNPRFSLDR